MVRRSSSAGSWQERPTSPGAAAGTGRRRAGARRRRRAGRGRPTTRVPPTGEDRAQLGGQGGAFGVAQVLLPQHDPRALPRPPLRRHDVGRAGAARRRGRSTRATPGGVTASGRPRPGWRPAREAARDPAGPVRQPARLDRVPHRGRPSRTGSSARVTALASSTASQPSSIASAASEAVPIPASRITGTVTASRMSRMLCGLRMPRPEPIGEPTGITAAQPDVGQPAGQDRIVAGVRQHGEPVGDQRSAARAARPPSGSRVRSSPITSSLTQSVSNASRASWAVLHRLGGGVAAGGVRQHPHAAAGPARRSSPGARRRVDPAQRDRDQLGAGRRSPAPATSQAGRAAGAEDQPGVKLPAQVEGHASPALRRGEHLDPVAVAQHGGRPARTAAPPRR